MGRAADSFRENTEEQGGLDVESQVYQLQDLGNDTQQGCEVRNFKPCYCPGCCFCIQGDV